MGKLDLLTNEERDRAMRCALMSDDRGQCDLAEALNTARAA